MKETNRFYSSLTLLVLLNAIVKPLWIFAIDRQVQNKVGVAAYGAYFSIYNLSLVLFFLLDWGLTAFYNRQLSARDPAIAGQAGSFLFIKGVFSFIYTLVMFGIAYAAGIDNWAVIVCIVVLQVLLSLFLFFRAIITSQQWFKTDAWLSVLDKLLMVFVCGILIYFPSVFGPVSIKRFILLQAACMGFATLVSFLVLVSRKFHFSFARLWPGRKVLLMAWPFAVIVLLMSFHSRIDGFLLDRIGGASEAGRYAAAFRLLDAANMAGYLFASFLLPFVARYQSEGKDISGIVLNVRHILLTAAAAITVIVIFLGDWIQRLLYHHDDPDAVRILQWCLPSIAGYFLVQIYGSVLTATGHVRAFIYITLISALINLGMNLWLIPGMGALGSCLAALVSEAFSGIAAAWFVHWKLNIRYGFRSVLIYFFIAAVLSAFLYIAKDIPVSKWLVLSMTGILTLVVLKLTKLVDFNAWKITLRP